jgi:hypothetical protein
MKELPVLIIAFNRPAAFRLLVDRICRQNGISLYVSIDGPRGNEDELAQAEMLAYLDTIKIPITINHFERNLGCALGVSKAIDFLFLHEEYGVILEDDILPSDEFFNFQRAALSRFADDKMIYSVGGFVAEKRATPFLNVHGSIWGWGTWRDRWANFSLDNRLSRGAVIHSLRFESFLSFLLNLTYLKDLKRKSVNTWDYQWKFTKLKNRSFSILPGRSLTSNIGFGDLSGVHNSGQIPWHLQKYSGSDDQANSEDYAFNLDHLKITRVRSNDKKRIQNIYKRYYQFCVRFVLMIIFK